MRQGAYSLGLYGESQGFPSLSLTSPFRIRDTLQVDCTSHHIQKMKNSSRCISSQMNRLMTFSVLGRYCKTMPAVSCCLPKQGNTKDFRVSFMSGYLGKLLRIFRSRAGEIAQLLRALANLPEYPGLIPSTCMAVTWL